MILSGILLYKCSYH